MTALIAVLPTIFLLVLGNIIRRREFVAADFWASADKLTYYILFPALLISIISQVDLNTISLSVVVVAIIVLFALLSLTAWLVYRFTNLHSKQFSSAYQGIVRLNTYIYLAVIGATWNSNVLATAAVLAGLMIPLINVCCIAVFSLTNKQLSWQNTLVSMLKNPLILGVVVGFLCNLLPVLLPDVVLQTFTILAKAALPLALLSVGAAVRIKTLFVLHQGFSLSGLWAITAARLLLAPLLAWAVALLLALPSPLTISLVMAAAVPTATSSYILSKQLGGDAELMAAIISMQTLVSLCSLVIWLQLLSNY